SNRAQRRARRSSVMAPPPRGGGGPRGPPPPPPRPRPGPPPPFGGGPAARPPRGLPPPPTPPGRQRRALPPPRPPPPAAPGSPRRGLLRLEALDRLVEGEQVGGRRLDQGQPLGQLDAPAVPAVLAAGLAAGLVDEDLAHGPGGRPEEVPPPLPAGVAVTDHFQVGLVDQGGGLEGLARGQPGGQGRRQTT